MDMNYVNTALVTYPQPAVYYVTKAINQNLYSLVYRFDKFILPERMYGNVLELASRIWKDFATADGNRGVMFTGKPGSGKSKTGELICNIAIEKGLPVIMVVEITPSIELIHFLSGLTDCVLFFDEFKKTMKEYEEHMLTMLTSVGNSKRLTIITENDSYSISSYILNRPERVRYHINANKIDYSVLMDYLNDYPVTDVFKSDLLQIYNCKDISFDQLQALVTEHVRYPNDSMSTLLSMLNLSSLKIVRVLNVDKIIDINSGDLVDGTICWYTRNLDDIIKTQSEIRVDILKKQENPDTGKVSGFGPPVEECVFIPYNQIEHIADTRYKAAVDSKMSDRSFIVYLSVKIE